VPLISSQYSRFPISLHLNVAKGMGIGKSNLPPTNRIRISSNSLPELYQVVVSKHLWDSPDRISSWVAQLLFGQVDLINAHSQLTARILSNSGKEFEGILIPTKRFVNYYKGLVINYNLQVLK